MLIAHIKTVTVTIILYRPTIEQLESLPVVQCTNSHSGSSPLPPPSPLPENEDELHVNGGANGEERPSVEGEKEEPPPGGRVSQNELVHSDGGASSTSDEDDQNGGENYVGEGHELPDFIEHVRLKGRRGRIMVDTLYSVKLSQLLDLSWSDTFSST